MSAAREIMERKIATSRASAQHLFEHVNTCAPTDAIVKATAMNFVPQEKGVSIGYGNDTLSIHRHALGQLAAKASIPGAYLAELVSGAEWQKALAANVLNEHFHKGQKDSRFLVRSIKNEARGVLSDRFRRLDCRPLLDTFAKACQSVGAVPTDGHVTDTRIAIKALVPVVYEPFPGEVICYGAEWGNSDFGAAKHSVRAFVLRLWCLNGATMEDALSQVHLGKVLGDSIEFSKRTYDLDTRTSVSALDDVVRNILAPAKIEAMVAGIRQAHENKVEWKNVKGSLARKLLKGELQAAEAAFESQDVVNLPPGNSTWRVSNAISWIAGTAEGERKLELQRVAGEVLNGKTDRETV